MAQSALEGADSDQRLVSESAELPRWVIIRAPGVASYVQRHRDLRIPSVGDRCGAAQL